MKPTEKTRKHYLRICSVNTMSLGFEVFGGIILAAGLVLFLCTFGKTYTFTGTDGTREIGSWIIALLILLFGAIFFCIGKFFFRSVYRAVYKEETQYPVQNLNMIAPELLKREAQKINTSDSPWLVYTEGSWIDVTSRLYSRKLEGTQTIYKKLFRIYDDGTYREMDLETRENISRGFTNLTYRRRLSCGHLQHHTVEVQTRDGFESFRTLDLANDMHRWFAEHGYALRRD